MNETISNLTYNFNNYNSDVIQIPPESLINFCTNWINDSTNAHNFYIWLYAGFFFLKWVKYFYNPTFSYIWKNKTVTKEWFTEIQDTLMIILFLRIIQVWYWVNLFNGGLYGR